jgi:hypothetical protein
LRNALRDFQVALVRVRGITFDIDAALAAALADRTLRDRHEIMQCACAAILSGYFEAFLKDVAEAFIGEVSALRIPFASLPKPIQKAHYAKGGMVLTGKQTSKGKYSWVSATPDDIARRLASVRAVPYDLLWEAFADTQANPAPDVVRELLGLTGLAKSWNKLATKTGTSEQTLETQLESFLAVRNECAHTGKATVIPTPGDIRGYTAFFAKLSRGIVNILEDHLASTEFNRSLAVPLPAAITPGLAATTAPASPAPAGILQWLRSLGQSVRAFLRR